MRHLLVFSLLLTVAQLKRPFCPGDGKPGKPPKCQSRDNQYKCGVFLEALITEHPITWLGALPDALKKVTPAEYKEILGEDISPESFDNHNCDITAANSRCYATLAKFKGDPLDSCEKNLVNTKSTQTVGDFLCGQVKMAEKRRGLQGEREGQHQ